MLRVALFTILASLLVFAFDIHVQVPPVYDYRLRDESSILPGEDGHIEWSLDEIPNPNVTDHLVFETVYSLLQHWPNVRMRNGER